MNDRQARTNHAFSEVWVFLGQLPKDPAPPDTLARLREALATRRSRIRELLGQQGAARAGRMDATREVEALRQRIRRERMKAIVRIAKGTLKFARGESVMKVPPTRASSEAVVQRASQMMKVIKTHRKLLVGAGLSEDLVAQFQKETRRLKTEFGRVHNARLQYTRVTRSLAKEFADGMRALTQIEGILIGHYGSQSVVFRDWLGARRVHAKVGRPRGSSSQEGDAGPSEAS